MFFRKKQKEWNMTLTPTVKGVNFSFFIQEGKKSYPLQLPLNRLDIEQYYKLPGFVQYIAWEQLNDAGLIEEEHLSYESYYELLEDDEGKEILQSLGLPIEPVSLKGELSLKSLPDEGKLSLKLVTSDGRNLDRVARNEGAIYQMNEELLLLPKSIYELKQAMNEQYDSGYQKIGVCQQLAQEAGIKLENFLTNETYHVLDQYELDVKVHGHDHIELMPKGESDMGTLTLNQPDTVTSFKEGMKRNRFVKTNDVAEDLKVISTKRHIRGEEVPLFFENPAAVLPEHDFLIDLEAFSDRVRGLVPIERVKASFGGGTGLQWFNEDTGNAVPYEPSFLKELMEKYPDQQYVQHEGKWIYLDPTLRKKLLEEPDVESSIKQSYALDIKDNEDELEYRLDATDALKLKPFSIPADLQANLFEHQLEGFQWLCHLEEEGRGGLLADDMGLGKTIQVITFLLHMKAKQKLKPTLIVLPIALIENWVEEIRKFAPSLMQSLYIHKGSNRLSSADVISQYDLVFTSYDTLKIDQLVLGKVKFQSVICDEAQNVKSHSSQRSRALRAMQSSFRLAMTGTPVENSLDELWSIMDFVQPGYLQSLREFRRTYVESGNYEGLLEAIKPYYLRRTKKGVLDDRLPKKHDDQVRYVEASTVQKSLAQSMLDTKETGQIAILNMLMRLRQMYGHPGVIIPQYETLSEQEVPKLKATLDIIDDIYKKGEKVLIFTEFRKIHFILKSLFMMKYGISVPVIDGDTKNRQAVVKAFNESPGFGIMLLSPKAAGVGLTITSANHVIHYTRWWNPAVENQATDRAYRIGQTKDVHVYQIITTDKGNFPQGTVEELMHELLESKRDLAENVIIPFDMKDIQREVAERIGL